jgi:hypothetical protein
MNQPYRSKSCPDASPWESTTAHACFVCRARAALARVRIRTALVAVLATGVVGANIAFTLVAYSSARESAQAVASMDTTLSAIVQRSPPLEKTARAASQTPPVGADVLRWKGVVRLNDRTFLVDSQTANDILEEQGGAMRQAAIVPEQVKGKVVGMRLFGVTPDSLLGMLGIENGDRIETVNGYEMSNPENAMSAYNSLRRKNDVLVRLSRRGQTISLQYRIV